MKAVVVALAACLIGPTVCVATNPGCDTCDPNDTSTYTDQYQTAPWPQPQAEYYTSSPVLWRQVIVRFKTYSGMTASQQAQAFAQSMASLESAEDIEKQRPVGSSGARLFQSRSKDVATLMADIQARTDVQYVEPNYLFQAQSTPNDAYFNQQWGLKNTGQTIAGQGGSSGADIGASTAWSITTGSRGIVVGIIDPDGISYTHPDLAPNVWSAPSSYTVTVGGTTYTCPAGSHGFNTQSTPHNCDPIEYANAHGTFVAGVIGASGNNSQGVSGVNWQTSILDVAATGNLADVIDALHYLNQMKSSGRANVRVVNNSYANQAGFSQAFLDEINAANSNDILFVAAAGNFSSNNQNTSVYPANYNAPNVISVAATNNQDQLWSGSDYGTNVHLGAPGVEIASTILNNGYYLPRNVWNRNLGSRATCDGSGCLDLGRVSLIEHR